jgi:hypothetical protein
LTDARSDRHLLHESRAARVGQVEMAPMSKVALIQFEQAGVVRGMTALGRGLFGTIMTITTRSRDGSG